MKILTIFGLLLLIPVSGMAQNKKSIMLEYCYEQIDNEFPLARKLELQDQITALNVRLRQSGLYPEILVNGSVSYQSDVTEVPFAGPTAPEFSKDHYNISMDISQTIFDGGRTSRLKELERNSGSVAKAGVEIELWNLRSQIEQVYFGILLMQKQKATIELLLEDLNEQLSAVQSRVENGVLLKSNALILRAEILKVRQQLSTVESDLNAGFNVLGELIGEDLDPEIKILTPGSMNIDSTAGAELHRAEYEMFEEQQEVLKSQVGTIKADKLPVISAFAKTAYARPGLNAFDDDLQFYWVVGVRAQWSFRNWRNSDRKSQVVQVQQEQLQADEDAFTRQLKASLRQTESEIKALEEQIQLDEQVLELRTEVVKEKQSQLNEGVITSTEYITELNAENRARLNLEIHQVQLIQARYEYLNKRGITWN